MSEKQIDRKLGIDTTGIREWYMATNHYHRYEPTPYWALDQLFKEYSLERTDKVVDFGCGRGRVAFYIHYLFQTSVTGVEGNYLTYEDALDNQREYQKLHVKGSNNEIEFVHCLAQHYPIKQDENCFYFFNPFSPKIFKLVVHNILVSTEQQPRPVDIILYYPTPRYEQFLEMDTPFKLHHKIMLQGTNDNREKFLIYRCA